jgi:hypothetical protein
MSRAQFEWLIGGPSDGPTGVYAPFFRTGYIQYAGPNGTFAGDINFEFGLNLPNPSGTSGPALLLGSGAGNGVANPFWIIMDQAYDLATPGNMLGITAGEAQPNSTRAGGALQVYGGAADLGTGGATLLQGGTSARQNGGAVTVAGGSATAGGIPGDVFIIGGSGQAPGRGANVHLIMTLNNGIAGDVRIRVNSTILVQFLQFGEIYLTASGTGAGLAGQPLVSGGVGAAARWQAGFTGTIATAKLTPGGANGSMTFASGILVSQVGAT